MPSIDEKSGEGSPGTQLPAWGTATLPEPTPIGARTWTSYIGPGLVMMGIQIGGGEWLLGPEVTARFGGGLMWLATVAIICQVFYNMEVGRYALYCGEPIFTGFMRTWPGPLFWITFYVLLTLGAAMPGIAFNAATSCAALVLDRPPTEDDWLTVLLLGYACLAAAAIPVLFGGKIYNTIQAVMTAKVVAVLSFTFLTGLFFVSWDNWWNVFSGFFKFGTVPSTDAAAGENTVNAFLFLSQNGRWPQIELEHIAVLAAFAGYAGGGGLSNSLYSNFVRDKGWGMGSQVGAIPSAIGGKEVTLSHIGKVFRLNAESLGRWKGWWRYIWTDQVLVWMPGCFVGMALPALLSIGFAEHSDVYQAEGQGRWATAVVTADGIRHAPALQGVIAEVLWIAMLVVGLMVLVPSQLAIIDEFSRRWTDAIWSGSRRVRESMDQHRASFFYYLILVLFAGWSCVSLYIFGVKSAPRLMILVVANLANVAIGITSFHLLWVNRRMLPKLLQPRWYNQLGVICCGVFYFGLSVMVFVTKQLPMLMDFLGAES